MKIKEFNIIEENLDIVVKNTYNAICVWDFNDFSDNCFGGMPEGWYKSIYPFIDYVILMTFTGGKGYNEWYTEDENGVGVYNFETPVKILKNVLKQGVLPLIVLGNIPYDMSDIRDSQEDSYGWGNRYPPKNYDLYYDYIKSFALAIRETFSYSDYSKFIFRIGTESDNFHWFMGTEEEYLKLYDYSVSALTQVLGDEIKIGPTNLESVEKFPKLLSHCAAGTNYYTGKTGTKCDFFSISHYELFHDMADVPYDKKIKQAYARVKECPSLEIKDVNVGEGQFLSDGVNPPHRLRMAQDITEYAASWHARNFADSVRYGISYFANWAYICDYRLINEPLIKTPAYYAALVCSKMEKSRMIFSGDKSNISLIASLEPEGKMYILCYNHDEARTGEDYLFSLTAGITKKIKSVNYYPIDNGHNNFSADWLKFSEDFTRVESDADFDRLGSLYETEIFEILSADDLKQWKERKKLYENQNKLKSYPLSYQNENGSFKAQISMPHHSVALLEITF